MMVARLFNTVGPRQTSAYGMVLPRFVRQALAGDDLTVYGDGTQSRCFTHVDDVVDALVSLIETDAAIGNVYNVGSAEPVTIVDLARRVIARTGSRARLRLVPYEKAYGSGFEELGSRQPDCSALEQPDRLEAETLARRRDRRRGRARAAEARGVARSLAEPEPCNQASSRRGQLGPGAAQIRGALGLSKVRVLRVIARLNLGGPAQQAALLSGRRLDPSRYETLLVHGSLAAGEESMADLARREGARTEFVPSLGQSPRPDLDLTALARIVAIARRFRPHVVHTHTAKAGFLGRLAALTALRPRPAIVHTYHGHVLEGYFGPAKSNLYRSLEALLGRRSDCLVGVSQATVDDLVRLGVAAA